MDKKAYITQVLEILKEDRPLAEGLLVLINQWSLNIEVIDALVQMLEWAIQNTNNDIIKQKLTEAQAVIQKIKDTETESRVLDQQDIVNLETMISNI